MSTKYTIEWQRPSGSNSHRAVMTLPRGMEEGEALALARGLAGERKGVELWKEEEVVQVSKVEL